MNTFRPDPDTTRELASALKRLPSHPAVWESLSKLLDAYRDNALEIALYDVPLTLRRELVEAQRRCLLAQLLHLEGYVSELVVAYDTEQQRRDELCTARDAMHGFLSCEVRARFEMGDGTAEGDAE